MVRFRFDRLLASTALAAVFAVTSAVASDQKAIDAAVPVPAPAEYKEITPADVGAVPAPVARPQAASTAAPAPKAEPPKTAETKPAEPAAADPMADKIREALAGKSTRAFAKSGDKSASDSFYTARKHAPLWVSSTGPTERGKAAVAYLQSIEAEGLEPADYPIPTFKAGQTAEELADAEVKLTASVIAFARHAQVGRVAYSRVSGDISYQQDVPEAADILAKVADSSKSVATVLAAFNPQHKQYQALKAQLAKARGKTEAPAPARIAEGPTLKVGAKTPTTDARVPQLRERLNVPAKAGDTTFDKQLSEAVAKFQKDRGLKPDGNLGNATVAALNGVKRERSADIIIANMERWRWVPRDLGKSHVILNIPDYTLRVIRNEQLYWSTKVVVGKPHTPTPLISAAMSHITVNPTWNVPPSIVYGEYVPAMQGDPTIMQRMGFKVSQGPDGSVHIAQPPGDGNALGRIRFNFPNKFLVYQHDTNEKHYFARHPRAYSHGCMRVEDPVKYAEVLLSMLLPNEGYSQDRIRRMYGPSEIDIKFPGTLPVHITYQTAFVDDQGNLQIRDDVYGRDARVLASLRGEERRIADVPVDRPQPNYSRPPVSLPAGALAGGGGYNPYGGGGGGFFEMLFGGGQRYQPPPAPQPTARQARSRGPNVSW